MLRSRAAALKWARERELWLIVHGHEKEEKTAAPTKNNEPKIPTVAEFCRRWMTEYVVANRLKPSSIEAKKTLIRAYLVPVLGQLPLDALTEADVQRLKAHFAELRPSTVNNILTCLSTILKSAIEWRVIREMPKIRKLKRPAERFDFYEDGPHERLVDAARALDPRSHLVILLGGDAGLRAGEMLALRWDHCDLSRGVLSVEENEWLGHVHTPKGNRSRRVVMTPRLRSSPRSPTDATFGGL